MKHSAHKSQIMVEKFPNVLNQIFPNQKLPKSQKLFGQLNFFMFIYLFIYFLCDGCRGEGWWLSSDPRMKWLTY